MVKDDAAAIRKSWDAERTGDGGVVVGGVEVEEVVAKDNAAAISNI